MAAGLSLTQTQMRALETLSAAQHVVTTRLTKPDPAEFSLMVPEKLDAFSRAGLAVGTIWWSHMLRSIEAGARAGAAGVAPVHRKAAANSRRLKAKATRRKH